MRNLQTVHDISQRRQAAMQMYKDQWERTRGNYVPQKPTYQRQNAMTEQNADNSESYDEID